MELNTIKKKLYKENHMAILHSVRKDGIMYELQFEEGGVCFLVPSSEIGEVIWRPKMEAKLLIRYIIKEE